MHIYTKQPLYAVCCSHIIEAFHEACSQGSVDVVEMFLKYYGDNLITKTMEGATGKLNALQIATMNRRTLVAEALLKRYLHN